MIAFKQILSDFRSIKEYVVIIIVNDGATDPFQHHQRRCVMLSRGAQTSTISSCQPTLLILTTHSRVTFLTRYIGILKKMLA